MLFDIAIEENTATSIRNNMWELTKYLKVSIVDLKNIFYYYYLHPI